MSIHVELIGWLFVELDDEWSCSKDGWLFGLANVNGLWINSMYVIYNEYPCLGSQYTLRGKKIQICKHFLKHKNS